MADQQFWADFWTNKSQADTDFQATGRGTMDITGFLYTVRECAKILDLGPNDQLLDVGCGTGIFALALSPMVREIQAYDLSPGAVERAQGNVSDVNNVQVGIGSITAIPAPAASCDKVLAYSVLQYLDGVDAVAMALAEIHRVLRPGGVALLAANPDQVCFGAYLDRVCGDDAEARQREVAFQKDLLWLERSNIKALGAKLGFVAETRDIHKRVWQAFYMFDLILVKERQSR